MVAASKERDSRYDRHFSLAEIGPEGQRRISAARALIIGAGGLGSPAALYLAAAGCGTIGVADDDRVELSNLQRQILFDTAQVGAAKASAARARLLALNPEIRVLAHAQTINAASALPILENYDVVIDGTDRLAARYLINDACVLLGKPLITAAIHRFEAQALTYVPGAGPCYRCLFPSRADSAAAIPSCADAGVLGALPGVMGSIQATEAIKLIVGTGQLLTGRLLIYDALAMRFDELRVARRRDCEVCGEHPSITGLETMASEIRRLSAREVQALIDQARRDNKPLALVDVREPREYAAGHLDGSLHIPIGELRRRIDEVPRDRPAVFICRSGGRSLTACQIVQAAGIVAPANLEGGLRAWSREIDPTLVVV